MKVGLILGLVALSYAGIIHEAIEIGKKAETWRATELEESPFKDWSDDELKGLMGTNLNSFEDEVDFQEPIIFGTSQPVTSTPDNFDSRTKWGACIHPIRNQLHCGSCWAFASAEVISDRYCIEGKDVILSPQDFVSCDHFLSFGCNGGNPLFAMLYARWSGLVTDACFPYQSATAKGDSGKCLISDGKCSEDGVAYKKYKVKPWSVRLLKWVQSWIKSEVYNNGPVVAAFQVYSDFMAYKSGIYVQHSDKLMGGHAVKVLYIIYSILIYNILFRLLVSDKKEELTTGW